MPTPQNVQCSVSRTTAASERSRGSTDRQIEHRVNIIDLLEDTPALTRRAALATAILSGALGATGALADDLVVFDETALLEAEAEARGEAQARNQGTTAAGETAGDGVGPAPPAPPAPPAVQKITVQTGSSSSIDGQGSLTVLLSDDTEVAEDELSVTERQTLQINRRTQKQNLVPPDFPLFARDGYDMTILVSNGYQVTDDGLLYKDYVVGDWADALGWAAGDVRLYRV